MRAVKIDPISRTVTEIKLKKNPNSTFEELYEIIGCDLVELVELDRGIIMVVDEEGKCKAVRGAFTFIGWGTVIAGTGIIPGGDGDRFKALPEHHLSKRNGRASPSKRKGSQALCLVSFSSL